MLIDIADLPDLATPVAMPGTLCAGDISRDDLFDFTVSIVIATTSGS